MDEADADATDQDLGLVDVTGLSLSQVVSSGDTVLARSVRRLLAELDHQQQTPFAGFGNFAPGPPDPDEP